MGLTLRRGEFGVSTRMEKRLLEWSGCGERMDAVYLDRHWTWSLVEWLTARTKEPTYSRSTGLANSVSVGQVPSPRGPPVSHENLHVLIALCDQNARWWRASPTERRFQGPLVSDGKKLFGLASPIRGRYSTFEILTHHHAIDRNCLSNTFCHDVIC